MTTSPLPFDPRALLALLGSASDSASRNRDPVPWFRPSPAQQSLFSSIRGYVQSHAEEFAEAGRWLDGEYSTTRIRFRERQSRKAESAQYRRYLLEDVRMMRRTGRRYGKTLPHHQPFARLTRCIHDVTKLDLDLSDLEREDRVLWARRIIFIAWLVTDPDAVELGLNHSELERWQWNDKAAPGTLTRSWLRDHVGSQYDGKWIELAWQAAGALESFFGSEQVAAATAPPAELPGNTASGRTDSQSVRIGSDQVRERLEKMARIGTAYSSMQRLADELGCAKSTVHEAIHESPVLRKWASLTEARRTTLRAVSLTDLVMDNARFEKAEDSSKYLPDDDVDVMMAKLIEEAAPEERARLNGLTREQRRDLIAEVNSQQLDRKFDPREGRLGRGGMRVIRHHKRV